MWRKRKGSSISAHYKDESRRKRWKYTFVVSSSEDEYEDEDDISDNNEDEDEDEWDIKCILDESDSQYLIDWEDPWSPTWVSEIPIVCFMVSSMFSDIRS